MGRHAESLLRSCNAMNKIVSSEELECAIRKDDEADRTVLRDQFAMAALAGILASASVENTYTDFAQRAWLMAEVMLDERARSSEPAADRSA